MTSPDGQRRPVCACAVSDASAVRAIVRSTIRSLEETLVLVNRQDEVVELNSRLKSLVHQFRVEEIDVISFKRQFTDVWRQLGKAVAAIFPDETTVEMMERVRKLVSVASHMLHRYQKSNSAADVNDVSEAVAGMLDLFEDGSVRKLMQCGRKIVELMQREPFQEDERLTVARSSVSGAVATLMELQTFCGCKRQIEKLMSHTEQQLSSVFYQCKPRGSSLNLGHHGVQRLVKSVRGSLSMSQTLITDQNMSPKKLNELRARNEALKMSINETKQSIVTLRLGLSKMKSHITEEREKMKERAREAAKLKQSVISDTLKAELWEIQSDVLKWKNLADEKRKEIELTRRTDIDCDREVLTRLYRLNGRCKLMRTVIGIQNEFRDNDRETNVAKPLTEMKAEIEDLQKKSIHYCISEQARDFECTLDTLLSNASEICEEWLSKAKERRRIGHGPVSDSHNLRKLQRELEELLLLRNVVSMTQEKIAKQDLETVRFQTLQVRLKSQNVKKAKLMSRLAKREQNSSIFLIEELAKVKAESEVYFKSFEDIESQYKSLIDEYYTLFDRRASVCDAGDVLRLFAVSEKWEELVTARVVYERFLKSSNEEMKSLGSKDVPEDAELSDRLAALAREVDFVLADAYANPEMERYDTLLKELRCLQKENKELTSSISAMLAKTSLVEQ